MRRLYTAGARPRQRVVIPHRGWGFFHRILTLQKKRKKKNKRYPDNICIWVSNPPTSLDPTRIIAACVHCRVHLLLVHAVLEAASMGSYFYYICSLHRGHSPGEGAARSGTIRLVFTCPICPIWYVSILSALCPVTLCKPLQAPRMPSRPTALLHAHLAFYELLYGLNGADITPPRYLAHIM